MFPVRVKNETSTVFQVQCKMTFSQRKRDKEREEKLALPTVKKYVSQQFVSMLHYTSHTFLTNIICFHGVYLCLPTLDWVNTHSGLVLLWQELKNKLGPKSSAFFFLRSSSPTNFHNLLTLMMFLPYACLAFFCRTHTKEKVNIMKVNWDPWTRAPKNMHYSSKVIVLCDEKTWMHFLCITFIF